MDHSCLTNRTPYNDPITLITSGRSLRQVSKVYKLSEKFELTSAVSSIKVWVPLTNFFERSSPAVSSKPITCARRSGVTIWRYILDEPMSIITKLGVSSIVPLPIRYAVFSTNLSVRRLLAAWRRPPTLESRNGVMTGVMLSMRLLVSLTISAVSSALAFDSRPLISSTESVVKSELVLEWIVNQTMMVDLAG